MDILSVKDASCAYGQSQVIWNASFRVERNEICAIVGANGAGKTARLKALSGLLRVRAGSILFNGDPIERSEPHDVVKKGLVQIPEGGGIFPHMTVLENLKVGAYLRGQEETRENLAKVFALFPRLEERRTQLAHGLSGGERQMLGIGKGLMASPQLLLLDEPSSGLAPKLVLDVLAAIRQINGSGVSILLVEQNVHHALDMAARAYGLESGHITLEGLARDLVQNDHVRKAYLGA